MKKLLVVLGTALLLLLVAGVAASYFAPLPTARLALELERQRSGLEAKSMEIPGFRLAYLEGGQGPPLVLLHGIGSNKDNWTRVARWLTPQHRVIALDLPGFGESDKPADREYGIEAQVGRLHDAVRALGLTRFHLGGSSMGGMIAASYAARYPNEVQSLWLISPAGAFSAQPSEMIRRLEAGEAVPLFARNMDEHAAVLDFVMADPPYLPYALRFALAKQAAANYALHNRIFMEVVHATPLEQQIEGLPTPTHVVWGAQDRVLHVSGAEVLDRLLPNASVRVMPELGHLPMLEAPRPVAEDYLAFRQQLR